MRFPWQKLVAALSAALSRQPDPHAGLSPDARAELEKWDEADAAAYYKQRRAAPPDAPHIDEDGI